MYESYKNIPKEKISTIEMPLKKMLDSEISLRQMPAVQIPVK